MIFYEDSHEREKRKTKNKEKNFLGSSRRSNDDTTTLELSIDADILQCLAMLIMHARTGPGEYNIFARC